MQPDPKRRTGSRAPAGIPVARPRLPTANAILPYLRRIDRAAWYSNHGPLAQELQSRLAANWGLERQDVALLSNATSALTLALLASGAEPGRKCLMPSWTFAASAGAAVQAGLVPHFMDVDPHTWALDPAATLALAARHDVGAIMVVAPFGAPLDLVAWDTVRRNAGISVVIDGAAAFDSLRARGPMPLGDCPVAVSLHATKVFGIGEGGALLCRDHAMMERVRRLAQFGFLGTRDSTLCGVNAKLSEYGAAVGLAGLDGWADARTRWHVAASRYRRLLPGTVALSPGFGTGWVSSTLNVVFPAEAPDGALRAGGVETLRWWGPGCHAQPAYRDCARTAMPVTEDLARRTLGLPFWQDMSEAEIEHVCNTVGACEARIVERVAA